MIKFQFPSWLQLPCSWQFLVLAGSRRGDTKIFLIVWCGSVWLTPTCTRPAEQSVKATWEKSKDTECRHREVTGCASPEVALLSLGSCHVYAHSAGRQIKEYVCFCLYISTSSSLSPTVISSHAVIRPQDKGRLTCCKNADLSIILPDQCESLFWMRDELLADLELSEWRTEMVRQAWIDASQQVNIPEVWSGWCVCCVSVSVGGREESSHSSVEYVSCQSEGNLSLRNLVWSYQRSRWKQNNKMLQTHCCHELCLHKEIWQISY